MADTRSDEAIREELLKQTIILVFAIATLVIYTVGQRKLGEPDFLQDLERLNPFRKQRKRDLEAEALEQVQKEISMMEHPEGI
jgi:hypothetical protein